MSDSNLRLEQLEALLAIVRAFRREIARDSRIRIDSWSREFFRLNPQQQRLWDSMEEVLNRIDGILGEPEAEV